MKSVNCAQNNKAGRGTQLEREGCHLKGAESDGLAKWVMTDLPPDWVTQSCEHWREGLWVGLE